ncbi:hypothetical protein L228DRAFT_224137 [Xylona heveae TC161]|uniref:rRNA methyltransferase 1, mitochondrial n=1 Tax=Xylona heveae (strain CBS 132557 / TC161) TaxID=1328760 RepID=A0A164ZVB0_XYLHT|nr:hypothetical protein L228DRAFT_224137 [Xylona heveae TC161]KZF19578.1 hypothetical protein L228DRAFT_224137 [Xylona heveae TC161]
MISNMRHQLLLQTGRLCCAQTLIAAGRQQLSTSAPLQVSLNTAINRGIRKSRGSDGPRRTSERPREWDPADAHTLDYDSRPPKSRGKYPEQQKRGGPPRRADDKPDQPRRRWESKPNKIGGDGKDRRDRREYASQRADKPNSTQKNTWKSKAPIYIPYTTSASEFVYGTSSVTAALASKRRRLYTLYLYTGEDGKQAIDKKLERLARNSGVLLRQVSGDWIRVLDKMSKGRPHNNCVLEASPVPQLPVAALGQASPVGEVFHTTLRYQSEEEAAVNGTDDQIHYDSKGQRYPLVLMLHEILDPGNLGAILRSAYFFGVDAVVIGSRTCAPLTPIAQKSSAGACEFLPLLNIQDARAFLAQSQTNGWRVCAAVAPPPASPSSTPSSTSSTFRSGSSTTPHLDSTITPQTQTKHINPSSLPSLLTAQPTILVVGSEGVGLPRYLVSQANHHVSIPGSRAGKGGVDSLNVSVAAALLCNFFMSGNGNGAGAGSAVGAVDSTTLNHVASDAGAAGVEEAESPNGDAGKSGKMF